LLDLATSQGERWQPSSSVLHELVDSAEATGIEPRLLLAVLIRESGDRHSFDWLSRTLLGQLGDFSIGIANMRLLTFEEARAYSNGAIDFGWDAIKTDPGKAIRAAAFLLAKRTGQLDPHRSRRFTDGQYARVGYRAGPDVMRWAERTGLYPPGVELFDLAYQTAGRVLSTSLGDSSAFRVVPRNR
jgi:hypothetical protein